MFRKTIYIIGSAGIPARYGGFETFAENISLKLSQNHSVTVICHRKLYHKNERSKFFHDNIHLIFLPIQPNGIYSLIYDLVSLFIAYRKADLIIMLGSGAGVFIPIFAFLGKAKLIVHVDGIEWRRSKWNPMAKLFLRIGTQLSIKYADWLLLDNIALQAEIPSRYKNKLIHTCYGGDHLPAFVKSDMLTSKPFALVIARAEPENNLYLIIEAFKRISMLDLIIISNWTKTRYGRKLFKELNKPPHIKLMGPIYDDKSKLQAYRQQCKVYIHGHSVGGTNPALVEAMWTGIPIIAYDNDFNRITTNNLAVYFKSSDELINKITGINHGIIATFEHEMQQYAYKHYTWDSSAVSLLKVIESDSS